MQFTWSITMSRTGWVLIQQLQPSHSNIFFSDFLFCFHLGFKWCRTSEFMWNFKEQKCFERHFGQWKICSIRINVRKLIELYNWCLVDAFLFEIKGLGQLRFGRCWCSRFVLGFVFRFRFLGFGFRYVGIGLRYFI